MTGKSFPLVPNSKSETKKIVVSINVSTRLKPKIFSCEILTKKIINFGSEWTIISARIKILLLHKFKLVLVVLSLINRTGIATDRNTTSINHMEKIMLYVAINRVINKHVINNVIKY